LSCPPRWFARQPTFGLVDVVHVELNDLAIRRDQHPEIGAAVVELVHQDRTVEIDHMVVQHLA